MRTTLIEIRTSSAILDGRPVYSLLALIDGQTYFVTWEHRGRLDALDQIALWAIQTGTPGGLWYVCFCAAEGTIQKEAKERKAR